jgi:hypothetical protein
LKLIRYVIRLSGGLLGLDALDGTYLWIEHFERGVGPRKYEQELRPGVQESVRIISMEIPQ